MGRVEKYRNIVYGLIAITPLIFIPRLADCFNQPKFIWISFLNFFLILLFLIVKQGHQIQIKKKNFLLPFLLIILWSLTCFSKCINVFEAINWLLRFLLFFIFYIFATEIIEERDIEKIMKFILIACLFVSIYGFFQIAGIDFVSWSIKKSPFGTIGRRNFAAELLVVIIPYNFALIKLSEKKNGKIFFSGIFFVFFTHLILTFTRASYLGFFFSTVFFFSLFKRIKIPQTKKIITIIFLLISVSLYAKTFEKGSIKSRILIWKTTLEIIKKNPIMGVGPGNFKINYLLYCAGKENVLTPVKENVENVHNDFLEITAETGFTGLILFLFLLFVVFRKGFEVIKKGNWREKILAASILSSILGMLVNSLASFPFKNPSTLVVFFLNVSFIDILAEKGKYRIKIPRKLLLVIAGIYLLAVSIFGYRAIAANFYFAKCKRFSKINPEIAIKNGIKSILLNPFNYKPYFFCGKIYLEIEKAEEAIKFLKEAEKLYPSLDTLQNNLGLAYLKLGDFKMAEKHFLLSLKLNRKRPETYNNLGSLYLQKGDIDSSIDYFKKAVKLDPSFYIAYFNLGVAYSEKKEIEKAREYFKKALEINPNFAPAKISLENQPPRLTGGEK